VQFQRISKNPEVKEGAHKNQINFNLGGTSSRKSGEMPRQAKSRKPKKSGGRQTKQKSENSGGQESADNPLSMGQPLDCLCLAYVHKSRGSQSSQGAISWRWSLEQSNKMSKRFNDNSSM